MQPPEIKHKTIMYQNAYPHPAENASGGAAWKIVRERFVIYGNDVRLLPSEWRENVPEQEPARSRHIGDFLAGMTDRYATDRHRELCGGAA